MPGRIQKFEHGPVTRTVFAAVVGGDVLMARNDGLVEKATAASTRVLGVAMNDAAPEASGEGTTTYGAPVLDISLPGNKVAVARGCYIKVTYSATAAFGDRLVIGATAGRVAPAAAAPDARTVIGQCEEPLGVTAGNVGLALIY